MRITSSPGLISDSRRTSIASVLPQVTVISVSGSTLSPRCQSACSAIASRRLLRTPGDRVLVDVVLDRPAGRVLDLARGREIGHSLRQIDRAVLASLDRHAPDHALGEPRGLLRDQGKLHRFGASVRITWSMVRRSTRRDGDSRSQTNPSTLPARDDPRPIFSPDLAVDGNVGLAGNAGGGE